MANYQTDVVWTMEQGERYTLWMDVSHRVWMDEYSLTGGLIKQTEIKGHERQAEIKRLGFDAKNFKIAE